VRRVFARRDGAVVAGEAGADDLRVVDRGYRREGGGVVAVFACVGGVGMVGSPTGRVDAVVAAETIPGDVAVVEYCRDPGPGLVAVVALIAGLDVPRRLPGSDEATVAVCAAARDGGMVHVSDGAPCGCRVAVGTNFGTGDVVDGLCRRLYGADRRVATDTGRIRALKLAARMAAIAAHVRVCTVELEARTEMIERLLR